MLEENWEERKYWDRRKKVFGQKKNIGLEDRPDYSEMFTKTLTLNPNTIATMVPYIIQIKQKIYNLVVQFQLIFHVEVSFDYPSFKKVVEIH